MRKHVFEGSPGSDNCMHSTYSFPREETCGKRRNDESIHIPKKIVKNIHPPKDPKKRRKIGWETKLKLKRKVKNAMAKQSRKKNRV